MYKQQQQQLFFLYIGSKYDNRRESEREKKRAYLRTFLSSSVRKLISYIFVCVCVYFATFEDSVGIFEG